MYMLYVHILCMYIQSRRRAHGDAIARAALHLLLPLLGELRGAQADLHLPQVFVAAIRDALPGDRLRVDVQDAEALDLLLNIGLRRARKTMRHRRKMMKNPPHMAKKPAERVKIASEAPRLRAPGRASCGPSPASPSAHTSWAQTAACRSCPRGTAGSRCPSHCCCSCHIRHDILYIILVV